MACSSLSRISNDDKFYLCNLPHVITDLASKVLEDTWEDIDELNERLLSLFKQTYPYMNLQPNFHVFPDISPRTFYLHVKKIDTFSDFICGSRNCSNNIKQLILTCDKCQFVTYCSLLCKLKDKDLHQKLCLQFKDVVSGEVKDLQKILEEIQTLEKSILKLKAYIQTKNLEKGKDLLDSIENYCESLQRVKTWCEKASLFAQSKRDIDVRKSLVIKQGDGEKCANQYNFTREILLQYIDESKIAYAKDPELYSVIRQIQNPIYK